MSINSYYVLDEGGAVQTNLTAAQITDVLHSGKGLLWVDICDIGDAEAKLLAEVFHFHRLAIEDCVEPQIHPPKIDDYSDYLFIIVHGINYLVGASEVIQTAELAVFIGANYVVSNHNDPLFGVDELRQQVETSDRVLRRGSDFLAYQLIDALVDNVLPTIDLMSDIAEQVEEQALTNNNPTTLQSIQRLKRSVRDIHRAMVPQRELLNRISRGEFPLIKQKTLVFFRDIYDHLVRIEDLNMNIRESADNAITSYLSSVANRQNETMKVLAVVGAIFLPLTLLAGVYGMNFDNMPELHWHNGYYMVLGFMLSVITGALVVFWRRGWFKPRAVPVRMPHPFSVVKDRLRGHVDDADEKQNV